MNKKISTLIGALIITLFAVIFCGGILAYQYWWLPKEESKNIQNSVTCTEEAKICLDGSTVGRISPSCEFAACPEVKIEEVTDLTRKDFLYPYPLAWTWDNGVKQADFSLTAISLGERIIPSFIQSSTYKLGDKINALTLYFKINTHWEDVGVCLPTEFRIILNEEGDMVAPINNRFTVECPMGERTYSDQEVIFVVPESQKKFTLTTGGESNIFFEIIVDKSGDLKVEKIVSSGLQENNQIPVKYESNKKDGHFIEVVFPNGKENLCLEDEFVIQWEGENLTTVDIMIYEPGIGRRDIATVPANLNELGEKGWGTYVWKVGEIKNGILPEGDVYQISISSWGPGWYIYDDSDDIFSITLCKG
jgi:hypothetical protein